MSDEELAVLNKEIVVVIERNLGNMITIETGQGIMTSIAGLIKNSLGKKDGNISRTNKSTKNTDSK